jgi:hypothetical protein
LVRRVGYQEMTDHRFVSPDRNVQQTSFANGTRVVVNFGETQWKLGNGLVAQPGSVTVLSE